MRALRQRQTAQGLNPRATATIANRTSAWETVAEEREARQEAIDEQVKIYRAVLPQLLERLGHIPDPRHSKTVRHTDDRAAPSQTPQTMTLDASEFIRRVLVHVLPAGFHRMRDDGWLGHRHRTDTRARCRQLLGMTVAPPIPGEIRPPADYRDRDASLTGVSRRACLLCADGQTPLATRPQRS